MDRSSAPIMSFSGANRWLSNFWAVSINREGVTYSSVEHAYMAAKSDDPEWKRVCATTAAPGAVKRASRTITLRDGWDALKVDVMLDCLRLKFYQPDMAAKLLSTGDALLVEGNTWGDVFWGVDIRRNPPAGANTLGQLLMHVRGELGGSR